ncbi:CLUMA_CG013032, isoform A [Clunio marinus]|uniref:CLUMA_CG013032, isoform A n=1 Tax=Clunio marinus TaxID=568069 RepID=A0A1J1IHR4_9DIPT|nr:CLUMA_CG013032, isoform A [Clunio marinus]
MSFAIAAFQLIQFKTKSNCKQGKKTLFNYWLICKQRDSNKAYLSRETSSFEFIFSGRSRTHYLIPPDVNEPVDSQLDTLAK